MPGTEVEDVDGGPPIVLSAPVLVSGRSPIGAAQVRSLVDAAADAGFAGMSIWTAHHDWAVADGAGPEDFFDWHRARGLTIPAAEIVLDWATADARVIAEINTPLLDVAARAGAATVIAATLEPELASTRTAADGLAALCDLAADRGLSVSLEFLPWTAVSTLARALELVDAADRDNLGLVLDAWHWQRQPGGPDVATLRSVSAERIHILQLDDAPVRAAADLPLETSTMRLLPGDGDVDLVALLCVLGDIGASPVIVSEVFSDDLARLGPQENARRQYAAVRGVLHRANVW